MALSAPLAMVLERAPLQMSDLPRLLENWLQEAGGFAALGLAIWVFGWLLQRAAQMISKRSVLGEIPPRQGRPFWLQATFTVLVCAAALSFVAFGILWLAEPTASVTPGARTPGKELANRFLTLGGACALLAAFLPFGVDLARLRLRRIAALTVLSFKEALRRKVLWVFAFILLVFLFADWFVPHDPGSQLRSYVEVVYWAMTPLFLVTGALLAAFGIPNDVRSQTIHTVVTKPVERFEIVLGRFLGYLGVMSLMLFILTTCGYVFVSAHGYHPDALEESGKARVPIYGELDFWGMPPKAPKGMIVAREWEYRRYIPGGPRSEARAIWSFTELPARLKERETVPCEFTFDIYRTTKGEENKGIPCTFVFASWRWNEARHDEYNRRFQQERAKPGAPSVPEIHKQLAEEFGYYEYVSKEVVDHHTLGIDVPAGVFRHAAAPDPQRAHDLENRGLKPSAAVVVSVKCESPQQLLGVAKHDLYLLDAEGYFAANFYKGMMGLWYRLCLVIGIAVACSTYLSGVVSLLTAGFLYLTGMAQEFIESVASGTSPGGGPAEAFLRLVGRQNLTAPMDQTPVTWAAGHSDEVFRWILRRFMNLMPDVERFDLTKYVSAGFDISASTLLLGGLQVVGYLLPWALLAYYAMRSREVAS